MGYRVRVARMWWWPFGRVPEITAAQLRERLERGDDLQLVDVRTGHEFNQDHLSGAVSIPITELAHRIDELDPSRTTVLICRTAHRSVGGVRLLAERDFRDVQQLAAGMQAWWRLERGLE